MIIYIMGTGRSGSTLLGAMIASCLTPSSIHVGELNWYFNYNGLKPHLRTDWEKSVQKFYDSLSFELNEAQDLVIEERYKACILYLLGWRSRPSKQYFTDTKALFDQIYEKSGASVIVDSSKYPLRAFWLQLIYGDCVYIVRIRRKAASYYTTVSKENKYQPKQTLGFAWVYYNVVNILAYISFKKFKGKKSEIFLEDIREDYVRSINMVIKDLGLDYNQNHSLESGYVFEGNRMAQSKRIVIKSSGSEKSFKRRYRILEYLSWKK